MANIDAPKGFKVISTSMDNPFITCYFNGSANLFRGDLVKIDVSQESSVLTRGFGRGHLAVEVIEDNNPAQPVCGVMMEKLFTNPDADHTVQYCVASTPALVTVCIDPDAILEAQCDDASVTYDKIGLNIDPLTTAGNTVTGWSNQELDASSVATTNSLMFTILDIVPAPNNDLGAYCKLRVKFNEHYFTMGKTGVS